MKIIFLLLSFASMGKASPFFGIPVPGQSSNALDIFNFFSNNCERTDGFHSQDIVRDSLKMLSNTAGSQLSQQIYNNLYSSLGTVKIDQLMGKWYRVLDSRNILPDACLVSYYRLLHNNTYLASFETKDYYRDENEEVQVVLGMGNKVGPDPGQLLIQSGHPSDHCPYTLVKTGPVSEGGQYDFIILTQFLKHPLVILARDPLQFELFHKADAQDFLERYNFENPLTRTYNMIKFIDWRHCKDQYFFHLDN